MIDLPVTLTPSGGVCCGARLGAGAGLHQKPGRVPPFRHRFRRVGRADHPRILAPAGRL